MNTVRIKIRVCVDAKGRYSGAGSGTADDHAQGSLLDNEIAAGMPDSDTNQAWYWVEADVPLPAGEQVIRGVVEGEK